MKPVIMIDDTIELVNRGDSPLSNFGPGTIGHEVVKEDPGTNLEFSRSPVPMEIA